MMTKIFHELQNMMFYFEFYLKITKTKEKNILCYVVYEKIFN